MGQLKDPSIRDRNADSFLFRPLFTGSTKTRYVKTKVLEEFDPDLTADSAMALSAAAASPNMGKFTFRSLSFLLVLLNVRLGRWIPNPCKLPGRLEPDQQEPGDDFKTIHESELKVILKRRESTDIKPRESSIDVGVVEEQPIERTDRELFGLALSGGGIRSASVSLGITQTLHSSGLFREVDYLSSVSGGGYTATAISSFMGCPNPSSTASPNEDSKVALKTAWQRWLLVPPPRYLLWEMIGNIHETSKWINVSDGGHFENMGAYELLRRRCRLIIICDGEADGLGTLPGLSSLIRLAQIDFNCKFTFADGALAKTVVKPNKQGDGRSSQSHFAIGKITYGDNGSGDDRTGWLLYLRSSLAKDEDSVIRYLAETDSTFPHQSTGDQSFNELQFEAYRRLGAVLYERTLQDICGAISELDYQSLQFWLEKSYSNQMA